MREQVEGEALARQLVADSKQKLIKLNGLLVD